MSNSTDSNTTGARRSACLECRQRKVRCDGTKPNCQNCMRRGSVCVFAVNSSRDKDEMLAMIKELNERLSHAEQSLATRTTTPPSITPHVERQESWTSPDFSETWIADSGPDHMYPELSAPLSSNWKDIDMAPEFASNQCMDGTSGVFSIDALHQFDYDMSQAFPLSATVNDSSTLVQEPSTSLAHELYRLYFELEDHGCFMLDRESFIATMNACSLGPELLGLKNIVFAHAASSSPAYYSMQTQFYEASRQHFETAETGPCFNTIAALQTCILLAMYELKNLLFTRAWGRVSRALWMAKMFGLSRMDAAIVPTGPRQPRSPLAFTTDPAELEERRRTFWSAFILGCFTSTSAGWNVHSLVDKGELQITTLLPSLNSLTEKRLDLESILQCSVWMPAVEKLSSFQALIISSALYRRCLGHADSTLGEFGLDATPGYDFWMNHHHISEDVNIFASILYRQKNADPTICIRTQAVMLCLNYAVVVHQSKVNSPATSPGAPCDDKCLKAAAEVMRLAKQLKEDNDPFSVSMYVLWSVYVATQYYVRKLHGLPRSQRSNNSEMTNQAIDPSLSRSTGSSNGFYFAENAVHSESSYQVGSELQGYISSLVEMLKGFSNANPIAGAFESQIRYELEGGKSLTDARPVGQVEFLVGGA